MLFSAFVPGQQRNSRCAKPTRSWHASRHLPLPGTGTCLLGGAAERAQGCAGGRPPAGWEPYAASVAAAPDTADSGGCKEPLLHPALPAGSKSTWRPQLDLLHPPQALTLRCCTTAMQLPPTVISEQAAKAGLSRTLFERLQVRCGQGRRVGLPWGCSAWIRPTQCSLRDHIWSLFTPFLAGPCEGTWFCPLCATPPSLLPTPADTTGPVGRGSQRDAHRAVPHEQRHHGVVLAGTAAQCWRCAALRCFCARWAGWPALHTVACWHAALTTCKRAFQ